MSSLFEVLFFSLIISNSIIIIYNINYNLKFCISDLIFCPAFGSVNRCEYVSILSFVCVLSCFIFIMELFQLCKNSKLILILKKSKLFMVKIYILFWSILIFLLFVWTNQVEADIIEKIKNIFGSFLNLFLFIFILLLCIKKKKNRIFTN
jgi:hypothetical protein